jgi:hypothetical protein
MLHIMRFLWVLRNRLKISLGMAIATMYNFFSLGWAVTLACIQGLIQREGVFLRTPKSKTSSRIGHAIQVTQWETMIGLVCMLAGLLAFATNPNWRTLSLGILLFWQGSLYIAAPVFSLMSIGREADQVAGIVEQGRPILEQRAARWVFVLSMLLIAAFSLIRILPSPTELPKYVRFLPIDIALPQLLGQEPQATASPVIAIVSVESANCRTHPRGGADRVTLFYSGQQLEVIGRNSDLTNPWWYVKIPNSRDNCWLWGMTARTTGNINDLPIIE